MNYKMILTLSIFYWVCHCAYAVEFKTQCLLSLCLYLSIIFKILVIKINLIFLFQDGNKYLGTSRS